MAKILKSGIDVSYAQGTINYKSIDKSKVQFVIMRTSFGWMDDSQKDNTFENDYKGFKSIGLPIGGYHYSYAKNVIEAELEAEFCLKCIGNKQFDLPIYIDIEDPSVSSSNNLTEVALAFCNKLRSAGYKAGVYTFLNWAKNGKIDINRIKKEGYSFWLAQWGVNNAGMDCDIWQYTENGKVNGISGNVDRNYMYVDVINTKQPEKISNVLSDRERFIQVAESYIGVNGNYICNTELNLGVIVDWCAYAVSCVMRKCGYIGKYMVGIEGGAGSIARENDGKFGTWYKCGTKPMQSGDIFTLRYDSYPNQDKYFSDHVGIIKSVNSNGTVTTLEGNVNGISGNYAATSKFQELTRSISSIYGFYRPNWIETKTTSTSSKPNKNTTTENKGTPNKFNTNIKLYQLEASQAVSYTVRVTAKDGLNIRQGAGTSFSKLGVIPYNTIVNISKRTSGGGYTWGLAQYNGTKGWIALNYTKTYKTTNQLAKEIIQGKWGNGEERRKKIESNNLDYFVLQREVNKIFK